MFSKYIAISTALLAAATSAAPFAKRDACQEGLYNCIDGTHYAQCISGGTWSATMSVAPGTTCQVGISANPFVPGDAPSAPSPPLSEPSTPTSPPPKEGSPAPVAPGSSSGSDPCGGFPCISTWPSYEAMKAKFQPLIGQSCEAQGWGANNSPEETQQIFSAIESLSGPVDPRLVLSIVIQESSGCVRVITTNNGVRNPGLMQDANGVHTCYDNGVVQKPCPAEQITGMIADGVSGGDNNLIKDFGIATGPPNNFQDAFALAVLSRLYNSGSVDLSDLNNGLGSTNSYVVDVISRAAGLSN